MKRPPTAFGGVGTMVSLRTEATTVPRDSPKEVAVDCRQWSVGQVRRLNADVTFSEIDAGTKLRARRASEPRDATDELAGRKHNQKTHQAIAGQGDGHEQAGKQQHDFHRFPLPKEAARFGWPIAGHFRRP